MRPAMSKSLPPMIGPRAMAQSTLSRPNGALVNHPPVPRPGAKPVVTAPRARNGEPHLFVRLGAPPPILMGSRTYVPCDSASMRNTGSACAHALGLGGTTFVNGASDDPKETRP